MGRVRKSTDRARSPTQVRARSAIAALPRPFTPAQPPPLKRARPPTTAQKHSLACPVYRHKPEANAECAKHTFSRVRDLKPHLRGRHSLPPYYCARCNDIFDDKETLCKHQKDSLCSLPDDGSKMDGLDSVQLDSVQKFRAKKGESVDEGWLRLWAIVTRNAPKPPLALIFMGSKSEEAAGLIRGFLDSQKPAIAAVVPARLASIPGITPENVGAIVDGVTGWLLCGILDSSAPVTATLRPNPAAAAAAGASNVDALGQPLESDNWQPPDGGLSDADGEFEPDAHPDDEGQHQDEPLSLTDVAAGSQASMEIDPLSLSPFPNDFGDFSWQNTDIIDPALLSQYPLVPLL